MKKFIKQVFRKIILYLKHMKLWYKTVIKEHHKFKLSFYHKLRAIRYGFSSDLYQMYNLGVNNPKDYISEYKRILSRDINEKYKTIFDNKLIFEKVFKDYINIPKNIIIILDKIYDSEGNIVSKDNIGMVLNNNKYIIKPISDTGGGMGVKLIEKIGDKYRINNKELDTDLFYDNLLKHKGYIISEFVEQHEYSKNINPNSVNTIRIITIKNPQTGETIIPCAIHRFGSKKSGIVDNFSSGGYVSYIDISNGIIKETAYGLDIHYTDKHPDTNTQINGVQIPYWDKITTTLTNTAKEYPYLPFIAWDVVVTKDGFSVIEINASTSLELFQVFKPLKQTKLGDFYKYYGYLE